MRTRYGYLGEWQNKRINKCMVSGSLLEYGSHKFEAKPVIMLFSNVFSCKRMSMRLVLTLIQPRFGFCQVSTMNGEKERLFSHFNK